MSVRKALYYSYQRLGGRSLPSTYEDLLTQDRRGVPADTAERLLVKILTHCRQSVPYYGAIMKDAGADFGDDPESYLL
jgi:hypothetical protein